MRLERAARLYRLLLGLAPRSLRERHADEMEALFLEALSSAHAAGWTAVPFTWMAATWDLIQARARHALRPRASLPPVPRERQVLMLGTDLRYTVRWLARQKFSTSLVIAMVVRHASIRCGRSGSSRDPRVVPHGWFRTDGSARTVPR